MITVRFPSGFSVQYNNATTCEPLPDGGHDIVRKDPRMWYARVPKECIVEGQTPCRTYNASGQPDEVKQELAALRKDIRSLTRKINKK